MIIAATYPSEAPAAALFWLAFAFALACCVGMWLVCHYTRPPRRFINDWPPGYYTTPKDWSRCRNLNKSGPTACWHPHCDCMTTDYAEPRPRLGADEVLRRHLMTTNPKRKSRVTPRSKT